VSARTSEPAGLIGTRWHHPDAHELMRTHPDADGLAPARVLTTGQRTVMASQENYPFSSSLTTDFTHLVPDLSHQGAG